MSAIDIIPVVVGYPVLLIILLRLKRHKWKIGKKNFLASSS
jgi:hypothetical protein